MLSRVCSAALNGIEAFPVEVEVNAGWGDTVGRLLPCNRQRTDTEHWPIREHGARTR
jgi:hypothetical protein